MAEDFIDKKDDDKTSEDGEMQDKDQPLEIDESGEDFKTRKASFFYGEDNYLPIIIIGPDNKEITPDDIIVPPDGGWGWVVVFAAFMGNLIVDGSSNVSGIILLSIVNRNKGNESLKDSNTEITNITDSQASWIVGLIYGCTFLAGPFVSLFANKYGFRITSVFGSVLSSTGFILVYILCRNETPNIIVLFLCYGVIGGIGFCFIYFPTIITVGFYFQKKRALATGIAVCGSGVGTFLYPPWVTPLTEKYGWPITILAQGAILVGSVILGCLYRPLKPPARKTGPNKEEDETSSLTDLSRTESLHHKLRLRFLSVIPEIDLKNTDVLAVNNSDDSYNGSSNESDEAVHTAASTLQIGGRKQTWRMASSHGFKLAPPHALKSTPSNILKSSPSNILKPSIIKTESSVSITHEKTGWHHSPIAVQSGQNIASHTVKEDGMNFKESHRLSGLSIVSSTGTEDEHPRNMSVISGYGHRKTLRLVNATSVMDTREEGKIITLLLPDDSEEDIVQSRVYRVADKNTLNSPFNNSSIFYPGTLSRIPDYDDTEEALTWEAVQVPIAELEDLATVAFRKKCECSLLKKMLDISLLKSCTFILLLMSTTFTILGFFTPFSYLPALVMDIKLPNSKSKFSDEEAGQLISIIGVTNTISRIVIGAIADKLGTHILIVSNIGLTIGGLITIAAPFLEEYYMLVIYSGLYGIAVACYMSLRSIIMVQLLGIAKLTNAFGLILLFSGISALLGSPLSGILFDLTGNYKLSFIVSGGVLTLSGVLSYPLRYVHHWEIRRKLKQRPIET